MNRKLLESILNIDMITDELMNSVRDIYKYKISHEHQITKSILKYNYILVCSFLDELDIVNSFSKENDLIKDIMWSISPLRRAINEYNGIKKGRNAYFAHYNRDQNNNFYPWWRSLHGVKLPRTIKEIVFLHSVLASIRAILKSQFLIELNQIKSEFQPEVDGYIKFVIEQEQTALQKADNVKELVDEVEKRLTSKNISIRILM
jgi:hypothetical protein